MRSGRMIWEEILERPYIYRIREAGERENTYVLLSEGEVLVIDPRSPAMLQSIRRLACGMLYAEGKEYVRKEQIFFTDETLVAGMEDILQESETGRERRTRNTTGNGSEDADTGVNAYTNVTVNPKAGTLRIGRVLLRCLQAQGPAPGLRCLWLAEEGILFSGEAAGCDHLPEVPLRDKRIDSLGLQFETLRQLRRLPLQMILPGSGAAAGLDELPEMTRAKNGEAVCSADAFYEKNAENKNNVVNKNNVAAYGQEACTGALDDMIRQYCIRILEVYQKVPLQGSISLEKLKKRRKAAGTGRREDGSTESICKYLCDRKYLQVREDGSGQILYERGSVFLTDWKL